MDNNYYFQTSENIINFLKNGNVNGAIELADSVSVVYDKDLLYQNIIDYLIKIGNFNMAFEVSKKIVLDNTRSVILYNIFNKLITIYNPDYMKLALKIAGVVPYYENQLNMIGKIAKLFINIGDFNNAIYIVNIIQDTASRTELKIMISRKIVKILITLNRLHDIVEIINSISDDNVKSEMVDEIAESLNIFNNPNNIDNILYIANKIRYTTLPSVREELKIIFLRKIVKILINLNRIYNAVEIANSITDDNGKSELLEEIAESLNIFYNPDNINYILYIANLMPDQNIKSDFLKKLAYEVSYFDVSKSSDITSLIPDEDTKIYVQNYILSINDYPQI